MVTRNTRQLEETLLDMAHGRAELRVESVPELDLDALPLLAGHLTEDLPIKTLERFETILKAALRNGLGGRVTGEAARRVAAFQQQVGLLLKYKSYAIKCASPLGYSLFLQNPGQGFSFQRHVTHKTEVFHILEVAPGGYVFICDFKDWEECYDKETFAAWLSGSDDERYERFRYRPEPGDVFNIDEVGVVHTVIGCVLEEFATVSTDMVDRLHDQNEGNEVPENFNRRYVKERLSQVSLPEASRAVKSACSTDAPDLRLIPAEEMEGGHLTPLARTEAIHATRYVIEPRKASELFLDAENAASVYVAEGAGRIIIADEAEARRQTPPALQVSAGDLLLIPAGIHYGFVNEGAGALKLSEQRISFDVAFH